MKPSRSVAYAVAAVVYIAGEKPPQPILAKTIAQHYGFPLDYLLKILQQLSRADILAGIRGPMGGFVLTRAAEKIGLLEIIEAIDGPIVEPAGGWNDPVDLDEYQRFSEIYQQAAQKAAQMLNETSLADIINNDEPI